jgi:hypothetical protein
MSTPSPFDAVLGGVGSPRVYDAVLGGKIDKIGVQSAKQASESLSKYLIKQGKFVSLTKKATREATRVIDNLKKANFDKISKPLGSKMGGIMSAANFALGLAGTGLGLANLELTKIRGESTQRQLDLYGRELGKQLSISLKNLTTIRNLEKRVAANDAAIDTFAGALGQQTNYVNRVINEFQLQVEGNKLITETQGKLILDLSAVFNKTIPVINKHEFDINSLKNQLKLVTNSSNNSNSNNNNNVNTAQINQLKSRVSKVESEVQNLPKFPRDLLSRVQNAVNTATSAITKVSTLESNLPKIITTTYETVIKPQTVKLVDGKITEVTNTFDGKLAKKLDKDQLVTEIQTKSGDIIRVLEPLIQTSVKPVIDATLKPFEEAFTTVREGLGTLGGKVGQLNNEVGKQGKEITKHDFDIDELKRRLREQDSVNKEGNRKLDELLKWSLGIPPVLAAIPAKTRDLIKPEIPTIGQIGNAVKNNIPASTCRFDPAPINNHTSYLDKAQTGLITANAAVTLNVNNTANIINAKLGNQLTGGISGFLQNFLARFNRVAEWLHLDRALNILIWWQTLHNAYMLSNNLGQTLTSLISNVLTIVGIKDAEGNALDIGGILVGKTLDDMAKTALGEETWGGMKAEWRKYNRIYQAAANLLNSIQSIGQSILNALEVVGGYVASIGNALRKWGEVAERAYNWMNPQPSFQNKYFTAIENATNVISQVDAVASEVLSVQETVKQMGEQSKELKAALAQDNRAKQGIEVPEAKKEKEAAEKSKEDSIGADLEAFDKIESDD